MITGFERKVVDPGVLELDLAGPREHDDEGVFLADQEKRLLAIVAAQTDLGLDRVGEHRALVVGPELGGLTEYDKGLLAR
jgi:hypothetical protein